MSSCIVFMVLMFVGLLPCQSVPLFAQDTQSGHGNPEPPIAEIPWPLLAIPSNGEIPRFFEMADGLYRGGQPTRSGFQLLKERGIKTVINLRMENDESSLVQGLGMDYVHIPIEDIRTGTQIPEAAIAKYFEVVNKPANYPIFFHCRRGTDRTGTMAALYRMAIQGWDAKKAYSEARDIGMRSSYVGLRTQLYDFHRRQ